MPLYRNRARLIYFVHIPKAGGSTIEELLRKAGAKQALKYHSRLNYVRCTPQHMHADIFHFYVPKGFYDYAFTVVRNPFDRVASEYKWRTRLSEQPLPEFNQWLKTTLGEFAEKPYVYDNHVRPQWEFIEDHVEIFKLEDGLDKPLQAAFGRLKLPWEGIEIHHAKKSSDGAIRATRQSIELIRDFYAKDFKDFGYDPDKLPEGSALKRK